MGKKLVIVAVVVMGVAGFFVWRHSTRVDRYLEALAEGRGFHRGMADEIRGHLSEPRVQKAVFDRLAVISRPGYRIGDTNSFHNTLEVIEAACRTNQPQTDDATVENIARAAARYGPQRLSACIPDFDNHPGVTAVYIDILIKEIAKAKYKGEGHAEVIKQLIRRNPPADQAFIDAMVHAAAVCQHHDAKEYIKGLGADPRLAAAHEKFLLKIMKQDYPSGMYFLTREFKRLPPVPRDDLIDAVTGMYVKWAGPIRPGYNQANQEYMLNACIALGSAIPGAGDRIRRQADAADKDSPEGQALRGLAAALAPTVDDVQTILSGITVWEEDPKQSPLHTKFEPNTNQKKVLNTLLAMSEAVPQLKKAFLSSFDRGVCHACARALAKHDTDALSDVIITQLQNYDFMYQKLAKGSDADRRLLNRYAIPVSEGLLALEKAKGGPKADYAFMRSLSCPDGVISKFAATTLKERLDRDKFVDVLFAFLALKTSYSLWEVEAYEKALTSYPNTSQPIARNLSRLLEAVGGKPQAVPWIHKVIGLRSLAKVGKPGARPVVEKYLADTGSYMYVETPILSDGSLGQPRRTRVDFADLAKTALRTIERQK